MASYLHRTATTLYLCCVPTLEDSKGAGRVGLAECKGTKKFITSNSYHEFFLYFYTKIFTPCSSIQKQISKTLKYSNLFNLYLMITNQTFTMIKPNAVEKGHTGAIIDQIIKGGYRILALKYVWLSQREAEAFYEVHKERPFFGELVAFMSRSPIVAIALEKDNAVEAFRTFIGATDPAKAEAGTIRAKYGESVGENAIHGSDSNENAQREIAFFFSGREIY